MNIIGFLFIKKLYPICTAVVDVISNWCNIWEVYFLFWLLFIVSGLISDAAAQGIQPDQIIFTDVAMKGEHIRRSSLADLFLDT